MFHIFEGSVGIGTKNPEDQLSVIGSNETPDDRGIYGYGSTGIYGEGYHQNILGPESGTGVTGRGFHVGVSGIGWGRSGIGISGRSIDTGHNINYGGYFVSNGWNGVGVYGEAASPSVINGSSPQTYGGYFLVKSELGTGVYAEGGSIGVESKGDIGVRGSTSSQYGEGLYGKAIRHGGKGVYGINEESGDYGSLGNDDAGVFGHSDRRWGRGVYGTANGEYGFGVRGDGDGPLGRGVYGKGTRYDFYAGGSGSNYGPFTGAHEVRLAEDFPDYVSLGMIVSVTGRTEIRYDEDDVISISSTLPTITLSNVENDKAVLGSFAGYTQLDSEHWYAMKEGERFGVVNALGEGRVWVSNINGEIQAGDYITTSLISGYGQRQNDDLLRACTLGKAIENVDWASVTELVDFEGQAYKVYLIAVIYTSG